MSTSPNFWAFDAGRRCPSRIMRRADSRPIKRGRRCVPPHPGITPNCVSGNPMRVDSSSRATRKLQARANSSPPPRHSPWIAATVCMGSPAIRLKSCCPARRATSASCELATCCNCWTSALPAVLYRCENDHAEPEISPGR